MRFVFIKKRWVLFTLICGFVLGLGWYIIEPETIPTIANNAQEKKEKKFVINMVTGEFKTETSAGKEIEAYRWDPGTIFIPKDEDVTLSIYGVNGKEHPFVIEGTGIKGTVKKGQETTIDLRFKEEGIYRLICLTHPDIAHNGPMIAYLVVD